MNISTPKKRSCLLPVVLFSACLCGPVLTAQTVPPEMEGYVKLIPKVLLLQTGPPIVASAFQLINLYDSPLVAASWDYTCRQAGSTDMPGQEMAGVRRIGTFDAAATNAHAVTAGRTHSNKDPSAAGKLLR